MGAEAISNCQLAISNLRKHGFSIFVPTPYCLLPTAYDGTTIRNLCSDVDCRFRTAVFLNSVLVCLPADVGAVRIGGSHFDNCRRVCD